MVSKLLDVVGRADPHPIVLGEHQESTPQSLLFQSHMAKMEDDDDVQNSFDVDLADKIKLVRRCQYS